MKRKPVSATYIKTFTQCLQKFYFKYHTDKQPVMRGEALPFGIAMHEALEKMYRRLKDTGRLPTTDDYNYVYSVFLDSGLKNNLSNQDLYNEGRQILKTRLDSYSLSEKILDLELKFGFSDQENSLQVSTPGGTPLIGAMDKTLELDKDTLVILDYKTSRTALTDQEANSDEQLSLYELVGHIVYPQYKNIIVVLDYLRLSPVITSRTAEQREWFSTFVDHLYAQVDALREEDIKPRLNEYCGWCDYRHHCKAYKKVITDADLLVKPLELYSEDEFVEEWDRFNNSRKIADGYKRELSDHASNILHDSGKKEIVGKESTLYRVQNSRVTYSTHTILKTIPLEDCASILTVNKAGLDNYLANHPEYSKDIEQTAKASFAVSFFKQKKTKK